MKANRVSMAVLAVAATITMVGSAFAAQTQAERKMSKSYQGRTADSSQPTDRGNGVGKTCMCRSGGPMETGTLPDRSESATPSKVSPGSNAEDGHFRGGIEDGP